MDKRGRGRPRYSRPGGQRYIPAITESCGHGTRKCLVSAIHALSTPEPSASQAGRPQMLRSTKHSALRLNSGTRIDLRMMPSSGWRRKNVSNRFKSPAGNCWNTLRTRQNGLLKALPFQQPNQLPNQRQRFGVNPRSHSAARRVVSLRRISPCMRKGSSQSTISIRTEPWPSSTCQAPVQRPAALHSTFY